MLSKSFTELLEKEVDRKEFLLYAGLILLTITGLTGMMKNISTIIHPKAQQGFGRGSYGK